MNHRIAAYYALAPMALLLAAPHVWAVASPAAPAASGSPLLFAAPAVHQAMPGQAGSLVRVTVALIVVLAAVFAAAWFSRRMHGTGSSRSSALEVIAQLPLGPRERAVLVRVGAQQVLLGVASGNVRALHVLPSTAVPGEAFGAGAAGADAGGPAALGGSMSRPTFKSMLLKSLGK